MTVCKRGRLNLFGSRVVDRGEFQPLMGTPLAVLRKQQSLR